MVQLYETYQVSLMCLDLLTTYIIWLETTSSCWIVLCLKLFFVYFVTRGLQSVIPLSEQLEQFKEYIGKLKANFGEESTNFILSKSIVLVVASSNDIANSYFATGIRKAQYDIGSYTDMLLQLASSFIKVISLRHS